MVNPVPQFTATVSVPEPSASPHVAKATQHAFLSIELLISHVSLSISSLANNENCAQADL